MKKVSENKQLTEYQRRLYSVGYSINSGTSKDSFEIEATYQKTADLELENTSFFNILYGDVYYGKMDKANNVIVPNDNFISSMNFIDSNQSAFSFVVDAYKEMLEKWNSLVRNGNIPEIHNINLVPKISYKNFELEYRDDIANCYSQLLDYINIKQLSSRITNLKTFMSVFAEFLPLYTIHSPFFITDFIKSNKCSHSTTSLAITLQQDTQDYDDKQQFISSKSFDVLSELCYLYGFIIEKTSPSKIYFNIHSPKAKQYIEQYLGENETIERDFYNKFFVKTNQYDNYFTKKYIVMFYRMYVSANPIATIVSNTKCGNKITTKIKRVVRQRIDNFKAEEIENSDSDIDMWRFYLFAKLSQEKIYISQHHFDSLVTDTFRLQKRLDSAKTSEYLEKMVKTLPRSKGKERNFSY